MRGWLATLVLFACVPQLSCCAAVYYVSTGGSDIGSGDAAHPFQTISQAAALAKAGDTVIVEPGTYRESVTLRTSGTADAPIRFVAQTPGTAIVSGADLITDWQREPCAGGVYSTAWPYEFAIDHAADGKPIEYFNTPLWGRAEQAVCDGLDLIPTETLASLRAQTPLSPNARGRAAYASAPSPHLGGPFAGWFFADTQAKRLYVRLADGGDPSRRHMEASTRDIVFGSSLYAYPPGVSYVQATGFVFRYGASFPDRPAVWLHGSHNLLQNCVIDDMAGTGAEVSGVMRGCIVRRCGHTGGSAETDIWSRVPAHDTYSLNERCAWIGNSWKLVNRDWSAGGVKLANMSSVRFADCLFRKNGGPGLWFDIDMQDSRVSRCVFDSNESDGAMIEISERVGVDHCLAFGNGTGATGHMLPYFTGGIFLAESRDCRIENNACVDNGAGISFREQGPRTIAQSAEPFHCTGDTIEGNVLAGNQRGQVAFYWDNPFFGGTFPTGAAVYDPTRQGLAVERNVFLTTAGEPIAQYGPAWRPRSQTFMSLSAYASATGFDRRSSSAAWQPGDYRLMRTKGDSDRQPDLPDSPSATLSWIAAKLPAWMARYLQ